jgi:excisionase family DNA binding protein
MPGVGEDAVRDDGQDERMTVAEAAEALGTSKEAVRKRIARGTLRSEKGPDGTVYVYVPYASGTPSGTASGTEGEDRDHLYQEMRDRISYLERQVEEEREARRRADTLLARLMDRLPELEPPPEPRGSPRGSPETATEEQERAEQPRSSTGGPQEATERPFTEEDPQSRSWWRRMFGG